MEYIGYIAAIFTTFAFIPQVLKIFKSNKTEDLSLFMYIILTLGVGLWLIYGISLNSLPMILANGITFFLSSYIVWKIFDNIKIGKDNDCC